MRDLVLGGGNVHPTPEQLRTMRSEVRLGLEAGARMLSFGLVYVPGAYAATDELVAVAEEAAAFGAPLVPHVRNEGHGLLAAITELIDVARRSGAPLHLSHLKSLADESLIEPLLGLLEAAATELDLSFDQYPYGAGSTLLASVLPGWAQEGGTPGTLRTLDRREDRRRIARDIAHGLPGWENILGTLGPERIEIANAAPPNEDTLGLTLDEIAGSRGCDPVTAPRFLGRFAIRDGLIAVEEAVARLTARAADRLGLADRGRIAAGKRADLVLLDPERYVDTATYADPCRSPEGVAGVWVAGRCAYREGAPTGVRAGGVVR